MSEPERVLLRSEVPKITKYREYDNVELSREVVSRQATRNFARIYESLTISVRAFTEERPSSDTAVDERRVSFDVSSERIEVTNRTVVAEEVLARRRRIEGIETVALRLQHEELDVTATHDA